MWSAVAYRPLVKAIPPPPFRLQVLGPVRVLSTGGEPTESLLTAPRPLAVLVYLALARPRGLHSRDTLIALLWPETDEAGGRQALRNALHAIRQTLGDGSIIAAGGGLIGLNRETIACDAVELEAQGGAGSFEGPGQLLDGEPMQGFHVSAAPGFERWLDGERRRLADLLVARAWSRAVILRERGDFEGAILAARRAAAIEPDDELSLRRLLDVLLAAGDRASAVREYEGFARRLMDDFDAEPSAETQAMVHLLREAPSAESIDAAEAAVRVALPSAPTAPPRAAFPAEVAASRSVPRRREPALRRAVGVATGALLAMSLALVIWLTVRGGPISENHFTGGAGAGLPARYREDPALFERYLRGRAELAAASIPEARRSLQELVDDAPLYAPGWGALGVALYRSGFRDIAPAEAWPMALAAARRALSLDSTLAEAHEVMAAFEMFGRWDLPAAKRRLDVALALHPEDPELNNLLGDWHRWRADFIESAELKREAHSLEPLSPRYAIQSAWSLYLAHRCDEAVVSYRRLPVEVRAAARVSTGLYRSLACLGRADEAATALRESLLESGDTALARRLDPPLTAASRDAAVETVFRTRLARLLERRHREWVPPEKIMLQYAELQDADSTLAWLDSMYVERSMMLNIVPFDPLNDFIRDDPRFRAFLRRLPWRDGAAARPDARVQSQQ
jgi:DNA-binding SARP family transcriptional activator